MEGAENVKEKLSTEEARPKFGLVFAEIALQLVLESRRKKIENIIQLVFERQF